MTQVLGSDVILAPAIAIHGVGNHPAGHIEQLVRKSFERASITSQVSEFNWDRFADHAVGNVGSSALTLIGRTAESVSNAAALPMPAADSTVDGLMQRVSDAVYHSIFRVLLSLALVVLIAGPVLQLLILWPSTTFQAISWTAFTWVRTAGIVLLQVIAIVVAVLLLFDVIRGAVTLRLAPILVTMRRTFVLLLQPVILLVTVPLSPNVGGSVLELLAAFAQLLLFAGVLNLVLSPLAGAFGETVTAIGQTLLIGIAAAIVAVVHIWVRHLWIGGPLKVILDIVRYMGSPRYRAQVQTEFDIRIEKTLDASEGRQIVLMAHSLGSVIAVDSLLNSPVWQPTDTVLLVSFGSPVRRSFIRFFPHYLFPASVEDTARRAASRLKAFSWINIYRRWDYVGGSLGLRSAGVGIDSCTGQWSRVFSSHSSYWDDDEFVKQLRNGLTHVRPVTAAAARSRHDRYVLPDVAKPRLAREIARLAPHIAAIAILAVVGLAISNTLASRTAWLTRLDQDIARLQQSGKRTAADVTYYSTIKGNDETAYTVHHFLFRIPEVPRELPAIEVAETDSYFKNRFDHNALAGHVLAQCARTTQKRWWQLFKRTASIPCTRKSIALVYDVNNPESFWLPDFPFPSGFWRNAGEFVGALVAGVFFVAACALVLFVGAVPLFRLFLGLKLS